MNKISKVRCLSAHGYSSLSTCVLCVCEYGVCCSVCVFQSIDLSVSVYYLQVLCFCTNEGRIKDNSSLPEVMS